MPEKCEAQSKHKRETNSSPDIFKIIFSSEFIRKV